MGVIRWLSTRKEARQRHKAQVQIKRTLEGLDQFLAEVPEVGENLTGWAKAIPGYKRSFGLSPMQVELRRNAATYVRGKTGIALLRSLKIKNEVAFEQIETAAEKLAAHASLAQEELRSKGIAVAPLDEITGVALLHHCWWVKKRPEYA